MLNDIEFIEDSIGINLFYLRNLRDFCLNIYLSLPENYKYYKTSIENIRKQTEILGRELVNSSNGKLSEKILTSGVFFTEYTLDTEKLTEKLFDINLSTDITKAEKLLTPGILNEVNKDLVLKFENINNKALELSTSFSQIAFQIYNEMKQNEIFSYIFPNIFEFMLYQDALFINELYRIQNKIKTNPSEIVSSEFSRNNAMETIAVFINKVVNPSELKIVNKSQEFINRFRQMATLYKATQLTPQNQLLMTNNEISLVTEFKTFMKECIDKLLSKQAYFITPPLFLDTLYTEINYFIYILNYNKLNNKF